MKNLIKSILAKIMYFLYKNKVLHNPIRVMSMDENLDELINTNKSMVRFGDGEVVLIKGADLVLQKSSPMIVDKMKQLLEYEYDDLLVTIPDIFDSLEHHHKKSKEFWMEHLFFCRKYYHRYCNKSKTYGQTSVSRAYYQFADRDPCAGWFEKIRNIWKAKDIVVVEGTATHNGVGNDLLDLAASVSRIICPPKNAMDVYDQILAACKEYPKDRLFIVSLGVTAKFLVEDLYKEGYRVLDMGNVDMEYEWFLQKAEGKVSVEKHQILSLEENEAAGYTKYLAEIEKVIKGR